MRTWQTSMQERTGLLVVALVTAAAFVALAAPNLGIGLASALPFSPGAPAAEQLSRPVLGAPGGRGTRIRRPPLGNSEKIMAILVS